MYKKAKEILQKFIQLESASGLLIICAAFVAVVLENSPFQFLYEFFLSRKITILFDGQGLEKPILLWINDGLMAVFFLLVSLEIKREVMEGQLSSFSKASLPAIAAIGGIIIPALIYIVINYGNPIALKGWAIPVATDIAFAICVVSLVGRRFVPYSVKTLLLAIAIIDDIAAITIIALFYTGALSMGPGLVALSALIVLMVFNKLNIQKTTPYILVGVILWAAVLKSGVHATLAGVLVAMTIPIKIPGKRLSPVKDLENSLHPWVVYGVMPLFAFANAGVSFKGLQFQDLLHPLPLGIILGLFFGKLIGVFSTVFIAVKSGISHLPEHVTWNHVLGLAIVCGVGFTMSLFIGTLAFDDTEMNRYVRLGVLIGSSIAAIIGFGILRFISPKVEVRS